MSRAVTSSSIIKILFPIALYFPYFLPDLLSTMTSSTIAPAEFVQKENHRNGPFTFTEGRKTVNVIPASRVGCEGWRRWCKNHHPLDGISYKPSAGRGFREC